MAVSRTLAQLRAMARELADMETSDPTTHFVDDTELDARINEHLRLLYDMLVLARGDQYYGTSTDNFTVSGQSVYAVDGDLEAGDFYRLIRVVVDDGNCFRDLRSWQFEEYAALKNLERSGGYGPESYRYRLRNDNIEILPAPVSSTHVIHFHYVPAMTDVEEGSTPVTFDGVNGWDKYAMLGVAIDLANKEESDPSMLMAQRAEYKANILSLAHSRDEAHPQRISDTYRDRTVMPSVNDWHY